MRDDTINFIFAILEKVNFQIIGMALLTILIPLAIAILADYYQKRGDQKIEFAGLDLHVILDEVFKFKLLLIYTALIFLPTMFWETFSSSGSHFIEIILSVAGVCFVIKILLDIYDWVKGNVFEFRTSYLSYLDNHKDMEAVWRSVWQAENINSQNETDFFKIFSSKIDQLLRNDDNLETTWRLLNDFSFFINKRSTFSLVEKIFPKILEWHFKMWRKKVHWWSSQVLSSIIEMIEERALKEDASCLFFPCLKKHWEIHRNEKEYLDHVFGIFYQIFFENIGNIPVRERYDIWKYFQSECSKWMVTKKNLKGENNLISRISLVCFLNWAQERIEKSEEKFDEKLDDVAKNLFPEVEPITWSRILIFCLTPWGENRIKEVIEHPWNFGLTGMPSGGYRLPKKDDETDARKAHEEEVQNTFELATMLFKDTFSKENLERHIEELKGLEGKYKDDSLEEVKRAGLLHIFNEMKDFLRNREKQVT